MFVVMVVIKRAITRTIIKAVRRTTKKGFTLIEIMVVVFILATLSLIAVVAINQADERRFFIPTMRKTADLVKSAVEFSTLQGSAYGIVTESGD